MTSWQMRTLANGHAGVCWSYVRTARCHENTATAAGCFSLNALNSHVLGLNASITRLLLYVVNSQALLQNGMKSQAIWEHIVNGHVIRRTDI